MLRQVYLATKIDPNDTLVSHLYLHHEATIVRCLVPPSVAVASGGLCIQFEHPGCLVAHPKAPRRGNSRCKQRHTQKATACVESHRETVVVPLGLHAAFIVEAPLHRGRIGISQECSDLARGETAGGGPEPDIGCGGRDCCLSCRLRGGK